MTASKSSIVIGRIDRFAQVVSLIFHPLIVVIPTMIVVMVRSGTTIWQALFWTVLSACVANLPLGMLIFYGVRSGHYSDAWVSIREQRRSIYIVYGFSMAILLAILIFDRAPLILTACWISAMLTTGIGYEINHNFTKLSLHSVGMAGCVTVLCLTLPLLGLCMIPFALLVGWARIRLKHHTLLQILIGWIVSVVSVLIVFQALHLFP
jgi:membrane-associated phospholipid phosphatase